MKQGELAPIEMRYQPVASKLVTYHSLIDITLQFDAPAIDGGNLLEAEETFFKSLLKVTKAQAASIEKAVGLCTKESPLGSNQTSTSVEFYASIFGPTMMDETREGGIRPVRLVGSVYAVACVHENELEEDAIQVSTSKNIITD